MDSGDHVLVANVRKMNINVNFSCYLGFSTSALRVADTAHAQADLAKNA